MTVASQQLQTVPVPVYQTENRREHALFLSPARTFSNEITSVHPMGGSSLGRVPFLAVIRATVASLH